jgi:acyl carrier protein
MSNTFDQIRSLLVQHLGLDSDEVTESSRLLDDMGADSLDLFELQIEAEEMFGVELSDADIYEATTVGKLVALIDRERAAP